MTKIKNNLIVKFGSIAKTVKQVTDNKQEIIPIETSKSNIENLKLEFESLFNMSYSNKHSMNIRLGKLRAKRNRIANYYENNTISKKDYQSELEKLDLLEDEIKGIPSKYSKSKNAILLCRTQKVNDIELKSQEKRLKRYCQKKNITVLDTFKIVESDGDNSILDAILDYINEQKGTVAMICEKQDGLIHNKDIYRKINILCKVGKLELHFVSENLVLSKQSNINTLLHLGLVVEYAKRLVS